MTNFEMEFDELERKVQALNSQTTDRDLILYRQGYLQEARNYVNLAKISAQHGNYLRATMDEAAALNQLTTALSATPEEAYRARADREYDEYERKCWG